MSKNIGDLRAQLVAAEAAAKVAEVEATRAKVEALRPQLEAKGGSSVETPAAVAEAESQQTEATRVTADASRIQMKAAEVPAAEVPAPEAAPISSPVFNGGLSAFTTQIQDIYSWDVLTVTIGTLIDGGACMPGVSAKIPLSMFSRHLLVAGAAGTGKTRTFQLLIEGLSANGSSVLLYDVKDDLMGLAEAGASSERLPSRAAANGQEWASSSFSIELLSLGGADPQFPGVPVRAQVSDFGPILLARALSLSTTQKQALQPISARADSHGLELVDLPDLCVIISFLASDEGEDELATVDGVSKATAGIILRVLTVLESQGGGQFFGAPSFDTADLMCVNLTGRGIVSLLGVDDISTRPVLVSAVIMFLLANLFPILPEAGDTGRLKLVLSFNEAHLLFVGTTKELECQAVRAVRLIHSKGVGAVLVTRTPKDIPSDVPAQFGSCIQYNLRVSTPDDFKKLKATVQTSPRTSLGLDKVLTTLGAGETVVTVLDPKGNPTLVTPAGIWAPASVISPASVDTVAHINRSNIVIGRYRDVVNPDSAEKKLERHAVEAQAAHEEALAQEEVVRETECLQKEVAKKAERVAREAEEVTAREGATRRKEMEKLRHQVEKQQGKGEAAHRRAAERRTRQAENILGLIPRTADREIMRSIFNTCKR